MLYYEVAFSCLSKLLFMLNECGLLILRVRLIDVCISYIYNETVVNLQLVD